MKQQVVIAEDDPVSAEFFASSLARFGEVTAVRRAEGLVELLAAGTTALLVLDDRLGAVRSGETLAALRQRLGDGLPILLVSAELPASLAAQRIRQGASACLAKPMSQADLLAAVARIAPALCSPWDDASARNALGPDPGARDALRKLFLDELPGVRQRIREALGRGDSVALGEQLHRLRAGCGFCGATALAASIEGLAAHGLQPQVQAFESACEALLGAGTAGWVGAPPASPDSSSSIPQQRSGRGPSS